MSLTRSLGWLAALLVVGGCRTPSDPAPDTGGLVALPPSLAPWRASSFVVDVDRKAGEIRITGPGSGAASHASAQGPSFSLVGADVIGLVATNYTATGVGTGGAPPGKVLVTFDLRVVNQLTGVALIPPTFPIPPAPGSHLYLFPLEAMPTTTSGSVGASGNDVIVELPNHGSVEASTDFDGAPHNFFNDTGCPSGANDCFRYEPYLTPLLGLSASEIRQVGFVVDPTVANFRARLLVAADLAESPGFGRATLYGYVRSPQLGNMGGVTVTFAGHQTVSQTDSSGVQGLYAFSDVPFPGAGQYSLEAIDLPSGCSAAPVMVTLSQGSSQVRQVDIGVNCSGVPQVTYPVSGWILLPGTGPIAGAAISVAETAIPPTLSATDGSWSLPAVPVGQQRIVASGLPAGCAVSHILQVTGPLTNVVLQAACPSTAGGTVQSAIAFAPGSTATPPLGLIIGRVQPGTINVPAVLAHPSADGASLVFPNVSIGSGPTAGQGTVTLSRIPPGCTVAPASTPYTSLVDGGTVTAPTFSANCVPAPFYPLRGEWTEVTASSARLTLWINMLAFNDPANNGTNDDRIAAAQLLLQYPVSRIQALTCDLTPGFNGITNLAGSGVISVVSTNIFGTSGSRVDLVSCLFAVQSGPPARLFITNTLLLGDQLGYDFTANVAGGIDVLP